MNDETTKVESGNIDTIINDVVSDVAPPSPIADAEVSASLFGRNNDALTPAPATDIKSEGAGKRGRKPLPRDANGNILKNGAKETPRPKIDGLKNSTVSAPVNMESAGIEPCAELCVMLVNSSGMAMGGEAAAMRQHEILLAKNGFVAYFKAKGIDNVPAWVVLAGALSPYYLRIITETPAKTTISTFAGRAWFRVKEIWKARKNARSNSRNDFKRENDTSAQNGEASAR